MATWRSTEYWQLTPARSGPHFRNQSDVQMCVREYLIDGHPEKVRQAQIDFLGQHKVVNDPDLSLNYISRKKPHPLPLYKREKDNGDVSYMFASGVEVLENYTLTSADIVYPEGPLPNFKFAKLRVQYTAFRYTILDDAEADKDVFGLPDEGELGRYITRFYKPFKRVLTLPRALMKWVPLAGDPDSVAVTEGQSLQEPGTDLQYIHHFRPDYPRRSIALALGTVNEYPFDGYPAGTLLCEPPDATPIILPDGDAGYDIIFRFKYLPRVARSAPDTGTERGWNWFPRYLEGTKRLDYRQLTSDGTVAGDPPYPYFDFHELFRPDQP